MFWTMFFKTQNIEQTMHLLTDVNRPPLFRSHLYLFQSGNELGLPLLLCLKHARPLQTNLLVASLRCVADVPRNLGHSSTHLCA